MSDDGTILIVDPEPWVQMPFALLADKRLSSTAKVLYGVIRHHGSTPDRCFPGFVRLAAILGIHERTVYRPMSELEEYGWITRRKRFVGRERTSDEYRVFGTPQLPDPTAARGNARPRGDAPTSERFCESPPPARDFVTDQRAFSRGEQEQELTRTSSKRRDVTPTETESSSALPGLFSEHTDEIRAQDLGEKPERGQERTAPPAPPSSRRVRPKPIWSPDVLNVAQRLQDGVAAHTGHRVNVDSWYTEIDRLLRLGPPDLEKPDSIPVERVLRVIDYVFGLGDFHGRGDTFWPNNIKSGKKLRAHWITLEQRTREANTPPPPSTRRPATAEERLALVRAHQKPTQTPAGGLEAELPVWRQQIGSATHTPHEGRLL